MEQVRNGRLYIKKYGSTSQLGMAQVQNGRLYISIGATPKKTKQRSEKSLQTTLLCYSIAKSTLKTTLTFSKVKKTKHENFDFVSLLSSSFLFHQAELENYTVWANIKDTKRLLC